MIARELKIRKIFATNSLPTIEVDLRTKEGTVTSSVPMGTSTGKHEAVSLPADDAIRKFNLISRHFRTESFDDQEDVDFTLHSIDDSPNFRDIGGNVALAISSAFLKAFALQENMEVFEYVYNMTKQKKPNMPMPLCNMVGGWHGQSDIQEFLLLPVHQKSFSKSASVMSKTYYEIKEKLKEKDDSFSCSKNLESAWVTSLNYEEVLKILKSVAGENLLNIGLDVAASGIWDGKHYVYKNGKLIRTEQLNLMADLVDRFPLVYIEDPFEEDDMVSHATLTHRVSNKDVMICGDDLYATNLYRLKRGLEHKSTNTVLIKPNQVGTVTDTIKFVEEAKKNGQKTVVSHRSGETDDALMCHLAVGLCCDYVKLGISGERTTKINEMIRIEEKMRGSPF